MNARKTLIQIEQVVLLIILLSLFTVGYRSVSNRVSDFVDSLKNQMIGQIEDHFSVRVEYSGISPSLLNAVKINNLNVYSKGADQPFLSVEKFKISHDLFGLLFSGKTVISSITAQGVRLDIDVDRDREVLDSLPGSSSAERKMSLDSLFTQYIKIRNWDLSFKSEDMGLQVKGNNLSMHQVGDYVRVDMKGALGYKDKSTFLNQLSLNAQLRGTVKNDLSSFSLESEFKGIDSNLALIEDQRLNLSYQDNRFKIIKIKDKKPYDLNLTFDRDEIKLSLIADEFFPSSLIHFKSDLTKFNPWLDTKFSGQGEFTVERNTGLFHYNYKGKASLNNRDLPVPVNLSLDINGDDLQLRSKEFRFDTKYGDINWKGQWVYRNGLPEGTLGIYDIPVGGGMTLHGGLTLKNIEDYYSVRSNTLLFNNTEKAGDLKFLLSRNDTGYVFSFQTDLAPGNEWNDRLTVDGEISFQKGILINSTYRMSEMSLDSLSRFLGLPLLTTLNEKYPGVQMQSDGTISLDGRSLAVQINRMKTLLPGTGNSLSLSGFYGNNALEVYNFELLWNENSMKGSGKARFSDSGIFMNSLVDINNIKYELNGQYSHGQVSIMSSHGLKAQFLKTGRSSYLATLEADHFPVSWSGKEFETTLKLKGRYLRDDWELFLSDSSLIWKNSDFLKNPEISMTLFVAPGVINVFSLGYKDDFSALSGSGSLFYDLKNNIYNGSLILKDGKSKSDSESYDAFGAYNNGSLSMTLQIKQGLLDRFPQWGMEGRFDSDVSFNGSLQKPEMTAQITAPDLKWNNDPFGIKGRIRLNNKKLEVYELNIQKNNLYLNRGLGVFDLKEGDLVLTAAVSNISPDDKDNALAAAIETGFTIDAKTGLSIDLENFEVPVLDDFSGRFRIHPIKWNGQTTFPSKTFEFSRKGPVFNSVLLSDPEQKLVYNSETSEIKASLKQDFPVSMNLSGSISPESLNLNVDNLLVDLNLINYIMPKDPSLKNRFVVFRDGSEMVGNLKLRGTPKDPDFSGHLQSRNLRVLTPYTTADIKETALDISISNDLFTSNDFFIPVGDNGGVRAQGTMSMRGWGIRDYNLNIEVLGTPGAPISYNANGLSGTGSVTGKLRLYGDSNQGNFDGKVVIEELVGSLGEKTDRTQIITNDSDYPFKMNLQIETGKNDLIILPNPQVEIIRATAEPGEIINLSIDSRNKTLSMTGGVSISRGEIYYFDRTFQMTEGSITFNEDQDTFNPFLNVEAEIDTTDLNGNSVTIYLMYRNPIMDDFQPTFRSNPSMPEDQIISLFGKSLIPYDNTGSADLSKLVLATGGMVGQYGFVKPLELALKDSLNLDNVTIKTEILENALLDQFNRGDSVTETGSMFSMAKYLNNTSFYLGKFAGDSLYFSAGIVVDYDPLYGLRSYLNGVKLVPDLTIEMRTPFFLVFWNYNNRNAFDLHNTDFMKNNAIGLEWRYSY